MSMHLTLIGVLILAIVVIGLLAELAYRVFCVDRNSAKGTKDDYDMF
jgi:hypothetical protein